MSHEELDEQSGAVNEIGDRLIPNSDSDARYHSNWLNMIYPRLVLSKNLLKDDGVIFISIDDNEVTQLKKVCDEVFGESNFYGTFVWQRRSGSMDSVDNVSSDHEYILSYGKVKNKLTGIERTFSKYTNPDNDPRGPWISDNLTAGKAGGDVYYPITNPLTGIEYLPPKGRYWPYSRETMKRKIEEGRIIFPSNPSGRPMLKRFKNEAKNLHVPVSTLLRNHNDKELPNNALVSALNTKGTSEIQELFGEKIFSYPKSTILIGSLISQINSVGNDIILDFFSGSATTAHAVMKLNAEDGGNRKYIMVQIPEAVDSGFSTICEIGKERIRRSGKKIIEENPQVADALDIGFKVFTIDESNMKDVYYTPSQLGQGELFGMVSNIKEDRTPLDLLYQAMLSLGMELHLPIQTINQNGFEIFNVDDASLVACFDDNLDDATLRYIAKLQPLRVTFRESSFPNSSAKINLTEIFKELSPTTKVKVI
ncbi:MAG: site-specific DNA-methyltransferase [Turicibacter sp.]|nr:site-specific DNA-methyltransferase [Turicibacter sp.]